MFETLLTAWNIVLFESSRCEDVRIATVLAGRTLPVVQDLVGLFSCTVLLVTKMSEGLTLEEVFERSRLSLLEAQDRPDVPLSLVVRHCAREGRSSQRHSSP